MPVAAVGGMQGEGWEEGESQAMILRTVIACEREVEWLPPLELIPRC